MVCFPHCHLPPCTQQHQCNHTLCPTSSKSLMAVLANPSMALASPVRWDVSDRLRGMNMDDTHAYTNTLVPTSTRYPHSNTPGMYVEAIPSSSMPNTARSTVTASLAVAATGHGRGRAEVLGAVAGCAGDCEDVVLSAGASAGLVVSRGGGVGGWGWVDFADGAAAADEAAALLTSSRCTCSKSLLPAEVVSMLVI